MARTKQTARLKEPAVTNGGNGGGGAGTSAAAAAANVAAAVVNATAMPATVAAPPPPVMATAPVVSNNNNTGGETVYTERSAGANFRYVRRPLFNKPGRRFYFAEDRIEAIAPGTSLCTKWRQSVNANPNDSSKWRHPRTGRKVSGDMFLHLEGLCSGAIKYNCDNLTPPDPTHPETGNQLFPNSTNGGLLGELRRDCGWGGSPFVTDNMSPVTQSAATRHGMTTATKGVTIVRQQQTSAAPRAPRTTAVPRAPSRRAATTAIAGAARGTGSSASGGVWGDTSGNQAIVTNALKSIDTHILQPTGVDSWGSYNQPQDAATAHRHARHFAKYLEGTALSLSSITRQLPSRMKPDDMNAVDTYVRTIKRLNRVVASNMQVVFLALGSRAPSNTAPATTTRTKAPPAAPAPAVTTTHMTTRSRAAPGTAGTNTGGTDRRRSVIKNMIRLLPGTFPFYINARTQLQLQARYSGVTASEWSEILSKHNERFPLSLSGSTRITTPVKRPHVQDNTPAANNESFYDYVKRVLQKRYIGSTEAAKLYSDNYQSLPAADWSRLIAEHNAAYPAGPSSSQRHRKRR